MFNHGAHGRGIRAAQDICQRRARGNSERTNGVKRVSPSPTLLPSRSVREFASFRSSHLFQTASTRGSAFASLPDANTKLCRFFTLPSNKHLNFIHFELSHTSSMNCNADWP